MNRTLVWLKWDKGNYSDRYAQKLTGFLNEFSIRDFEEFEVEREVDAYFSYGNFVDTQIISKMYFGVLSSKPNYLLVLDDQDEIESRWYIMSMQYINGDPAEDNSGWHVILRRDVLMDNADYIATLQASIKTGNLPDVWSKQICNAENIVLNQYVDREIVQKDEYGDTMWAVVFYDSTVAQSMSAQEPNLTANLTQVDLANDPFLGSRVSFTGTVPANEVFTGPQGANATIQRLVTSVRLPVRGQYHGMMNVTSRLRDIIWPITWNIQGDVATPTVGNCTGSAWDEFTTVSANNATNRWASMRTAFNSATIKTLIRGAVLNPATYYNKQGSYTAARTKWNEKNMVNSLNMTSFFTARLSSNTTSADRPTIDSNYPTQFPVGSTRTVDLTSVVSNILSIWGNNRKVLDNFWGSYQIYFGGQIIGSGTSDDPTRGIVNAPAAISTMTFAMSMTRLNSQLNIDLKPGKVMDRMHVGAVAIPYRCGMFGGTLVQPGVSTAASDSNPATLTKAQIDRLMTYVPPPQPAGGQAPPVIYVTTVFQYCPVDYILPSMFTANGNFDLGQIDTSHISYIYDGLPESPGANRYAGFQIYNMDLTKVVDAYDPLVGDEDLDPTYDLKIKSITTNARFMSADSSSGDDINPVLNGGIQKVVISMTINPLMSITWVTPVLGGLNGKLSVDYTRGVVMLGGMEYSRIDSAWNQYILQNSTIFAQQNLGIKHVETTGAYSDGLAQAQAALAYAQGIRRTNASQVMQNVLGGLKVVGSAAAFVGGIVGTPFTGGASLGLTVAGAAGLATSVGGLVSGNVNESRARKEIRENFEMAQQAIAVGQAQRAEDISYKMGMFDLTNQAIMAAPNTIAKAGQVTVLTREKAYIKIIKCTPDEEAFVRQYLRYYGSKIEEIGLLSVYLRNNQDFISAMMLFLPGIDLITSNAINFELARGRFVIGGALGEYGGVPGVPINLAFTKVSGNVVVTWGAPVLSPSPVEYYEISIDGETWQNIGNVLTYTMPNPPDDILFRVRAVSELGEGVAAGLPIPSVIDPPTAPLNVQGIYTYVAGSNIVTLTWEPPVSDGGMPIIGYRARASQTGGVGVWQNVGPNVFTAQTISATANMIGYYAQVQALTAIGYGDMGQSIVIDGRPGTGFPSEPLNAIAVYSLVDAPSPPAPPGTLATRWDVSWDMPAAGAQPIWFRVNAGTSGTTWQNLPIGQMTWVSGTPTGMLSIQAVNDFGVSNLVSPTQIGSPYVPSEPTNFIALFSSGQVVLSWGPPASLGNAGGAVKAYETSIDNVNWDSNDATTFTVTYNQNLLGQTVYVRARNSYGISSAATAVVV